MENYYENTKAANEAILNELILDADDVDVANTLKLYDISKSAAENAKKIDNERRKADLEKTATYLLTEFGNKRKSDIIRLIIDRIATLLLEPCRICKDYYSVKKDETPLLSCYFCGQGCHHECYSQLLSSPSNQTIPGMFYICISCEVEEKANRQLNKRSIKPSNTSVESAAAEVAIDGNPTARSSEIPVETVNVPQDVGDTPPAGRKPQTPPLCRHYKRGQCRHGASGTSGGKCNFSHPKVCNKYVNFGKFSDKGCNDPNCSKWHPKICFAGVNTGNCSRAKCRYYHGHLITRNRPQQIVGPTAGNPNSRGSQMHVSNDHSPSNTAMAGESGPFLDSIRQELENLKNQMSQVVQTCLRQPIPGQQGMGPPQHMAVQNRLLQMAHRPTQTMHLPNTPPPVMGGLPHC